ncbi:LysR family transcriptional regulator [Xanthobacter tagetidis]|uniref:LysR family transcriptional regulator n=1 Tax=Xanthobacter tagetidis TaxID=60216 RepID=A0A3L7ALM1_9HYPH|nr:LysR family transcriptional regulator [Xanthobacter tagetidis]MBB6307365.1 DNA-binding transcriptional LysR family regulator [Xanthobacter tagetidis]RLP80964.1 LysR family transcriptional regulator [Xanthobacter tagetidis]
MLDLTALALLVETASAGSLAAGARRLRLSPMTASRLLATLERELGVRLAHRTTRAFSLTEEGQALLPHARAMLEEQAAARASVRGSDAEAHGLLRVTTSFAFGRRVLVPLMARFMLAHPKVEVDLHLTDGVLDIVAEGIDLAIRIATPADSELVGRRLGDSPRVLVAAPDYIARHGAPATLAALHGHACLTMSGATHWSFGGGREVARVRVAGRFTANSIDALHAACRGGLGIAMLSLWNVGPDLTAGTLKEVALADAVPVPLGIWAVYPTRRMVPAKVRLFVEALAAELKTAA